MLEALLQLTYVTWLPVRRCHLLPFPSGFMRYCLNASVHMQVCALQLLIAPTFLKVCESSSWGFLKSINHH